MLEKGGFFVGNVQLHCVLGCKRLPLCLLSAPPTFSNDWCMEAGQYGASKVFVWHRLDSSRPPTYPGCSSNDLNTLRWGESGRGLKRSEWILGNLLEKGGL